MPETNKQEVLARFRRKLTDGDTEGLKVRLQITGGMPGEQYARREVTLLGTRQVEARAESTEGPPAEATSMLDEEEMYELLRRLGDGADDLVERSEARFIPDSVVGSVTIEVDGEALTLFYLVDEEEREAQHQYLSPRTAEVIDRLSELAGRVLAEHEGSP
jgi:hypothetical protein